MEFFANCGLIRAMQTNIVTMIAQAFATDPAARWLYSSDEMYFANFPEFIRNFGGVAFAHDTADQVADGRAAALWLPPGVHPDEEKLVQLLQTTVPEAKQGDAFSILEQMGKFHPETPHWYLAMLGVEPTSQGQGLGSQLLQKGLERCDREGAVAYLESSNPRNIPLYQRYGFEIVGKIQAGDSPEIIPMVRAAQKG